MEKWKSLSEESESEEAMEEKEESNEAWIFLAFVLLGVVLFGERIFSSTLNLFLGIALVMGFIYFFGDADINLDKSDDFPILTIGIIIVSMVFVVIASLFFFLFTITHIIILGIIMIVSAIIWYEEKVFEFIMIPIILVIFIIVFIVMSGTIQGTLYNAVGFFGFDETLSYIWAVRIALASWGLAVIFGILAIINRKNKCQSKNLKVAGAMLIITLVCLAIIILLQTDFTTV